MADNRHEVFTVDEKAKLAGVGVGAPPASRTITAGAGLTGGGDLSTSRTIDVVAADGTIIVAANDIKVGTVPAGQVSGLATVATSGSASDLGAGALPVGRLPALTGDVTSSAGSAATTIASGVVTLAKLANPGAQDPGSFTVGAASTWEQYVRLAASGSGRVTISGTGRIAISNATEPSRAGDVAYDAAVLGSPSCPRISFTVQDGWQLPVFEELKLTGAVRCTLQGTARLMPLDFGQNRSRAVLAGSSARL